jgi:EAL and modified HD-GYP domain-containing signal transduction protein
MATIAVHHASQDAGGVAPDSALRYIARQPILDLQGKVYGYELLFRSGYEKVFSADGEFATKTMIDNTVLFGLERLTGSLPTFVNCTAEALIREQVSLLPPRMTVLEILETVEPVPELIQTCRHLKSLGFRLALDDFVWKPSLEPLIVIADYIKIDFILSGAAERHRMLARLKGSPAVLLAEKIETQQEYQRANAEGFTLFQGYYFCRPTLLTGRKVPANQISHLELLRLLQQTPLDVRQASEAVKRDAAIAYRLLRLVNSPACAIRQEVCSISAALIALGEDVFRRIATLAIASELNAGQPAEILRMAFVRARFCELVAAASGLYTLEPYLMGMFSMLPAMLRAPMEEILSALPLCKQIRSALLGEPNQERTLLSWLEANEQGDWQRCDAVALEQGLDPEQLYRYLTDAIEWAELSLSGSISKPGGVPSTVQA